MKRWLLIVAVLCLMLGRSSTTADLLDCEEKALPSVTEIPGVGPKVASSEETGDKVRDFFKNVGCQIKKGATKLGTEIKEGTKKLSEKAKTLGSNIETKFKDFKDHLSQDSDEVADSSPAKIMDNVEIIDPNVLKSEQQCGHGHILDALGNCRKLRK